MTRSQLAIEFCQLGNEDIELVVHLWQKPANINKIQFSIATISSYNLGLQPGWTSTKVGCNWKQFSWERETCCWTEKSYWWKGKNYQWSREFMLDPYHM